MLPLWDAKPCILAEDIQHLFTRLYGTTVILAATNITALIIMSPLNLLAGSCLDCWCNLPCVINCSLFLVSIKQEEQCKHNGGFSQYVMKNCCKDEMWGLFTILATFFFLICVVELQTWYYIQGLLIVRIVI